MVKNNEKKFMKAKIDLPKQVEEYLRRNASKLLDAPTGYVLDVFNSIMGYGSDYRNSPEELEVLSTLLKHFDSENTGKQKMGIQGVIQGGKGFAVNNVEEIFEPLTGVIANIRLFTDIPDKEAMIRFEDGEGKVTELRALADFILDGEIILIAYYKPEDCVSFFDLEFNEQGMAVINPIQEDEKFNLIGEIWTILEEEADNIGLS
jgi:hypothetical protein